MDLTYALPEGSSGGPADAERRQMDEYLRRAREATRRAESPRPTKFVGGA